jgi:hypothetical protein
MKLLSTLVLALVSIVSASHNVSNGCISFSVSSGTGCAWMCQYCQDNLKTTNYYFTDNVCTYKTGGCVGNPIAGKQYTCCSNSQEL